MGYLRFEKMGAIAAASLILLGLMGCIQAANQGHADAKPKPTPAQERPAMRTKQTVNPKLIAANTQFGFKLFGEILKQDQGKNVFVSPSSVAIALAMTYNGASGNTQREMARALQLNGMSLSDLNRANADLKALLENPDPKVQLAIANSLWARQNVRFKPDFMQRNTQFYGAEVSNLNFSDPNAPAIINSWVKDNTRGKIDKIVDSIHPNDILFLINAIYFKGDWSQPFDPQKTANKPFYRADGTQKQHPMMSQIGMFRYLETERFQAISLPYGKERRMSMYILLPKKSYSLASFSKDLTAENWTQWMSRMRIREGSLQLPRFKQDYKIELKRALSALGMASAFNPSKSDFSGITDLKVWIDQVKHKTFVEVNEEGTEAAAVTSIGIRTTSAILEEPFRMVVDRPFFCAIRDDQTGSVLFMGAINDPQ
jgi:serpin B